eukprot:TRINITY_DN11841_c0_g1_i1.p1 TRINITY_DN11841_c0_g1~~TRINITY_DN11841_c0_g1_i1.p1  ORF type:complete len:571 (-),score=147.90 TRINITY_DN11841_c0_g1_i1:136-1848(-)
MRFLVVLLLIVGLSTPSYSLFNNFNNFPFKLNEGDPNYGGSNCAACTIIVGLLEQMTEIHNKTIDKLLDEICSYFPAQFVPICDWAVNKYGEQVITMVFNKETPDDICNALPDLCTNPECRLFPAAAQRQKSEQATTFKPERSPLRMRVIDPFVNQKIEESPWQWIKDLINRLANSHEPIEDLDDDFYSMSSTLRGYSWRGKDCNDLDKGKHPGSSASEADGTDWNCNGIYGINPATKQSYEQMLCGNSGQMGVAVVGDSVGAHFSIPPQYMNASEITPTTYDDLLAILENEFDWPERSMSTGWENSTAQVPIQSIYLNMRQRNLCNHRDYQNMGVNGARAGAVANGIIESMNRNQTIDHPLLLIYEVVGNDVCNGHHTVDTMTEPEQFRQQVLQTLYYLEKQLPNGSHVLFLGLVDGRILWNSLHNRTHPIGVSYADVYAYLNCLYISPCYLWMNSNETLRNAASDRAAELSAIYPEIIGNYTFNNFDMYYLPFPLTQIMDEWIAKGGQAWQLIEPVDGFHPNQITNALLADFIWNDLNTNKPNWLGAINPNNDLITKLFGDQQGYQNN